MSRPAKVCPFFASDEGCKFGAACNFSHEQVVRDSYQREFPEVSATGSQAAVGHTTRRHNRDNRQDGGYNSNQHNPQRRQNLRPCRFFLSGHCSKGDDCTFFHEHEGYEPQPSVKSLRKQRSARRPTVQCKYFSSPSGCRHGDACTFLHEGPVGEKLAPKVCPYFMGKGCMKQEQCQLLHPMGADGKPDEKLAVELGFVPRNAQKAKAGAKSAPETPAVNMTEETQKKQRTTELEMLKKRYPQAVEAENSGECGQSFRVTFIPTDPDWPYDVKELPLVVNFPESYPLEMMVVSIPEDSSLPETVRRCVSFSLVDWVSARFKSFQKKGRVELMFRPFLRWLDRELEEIFTDALTHYRKELVAKEAGIDIIPARHLKAKYNQADRDIPTEEEPAELERPGETSVTIQDARQLEEVDQLDRQDSEAETNKENCPQIDASNPVKKGTEIKIKDLQLKDSVATLLASSIKLVVKCERCKHEADISTPAERLNSILCAKCNLTQLVNFRPALMHTFSSILGYLDLKGCSAFDLILVDCHFIGNCLDCNKDHDLGGIAPGMLKNSWCQGCHSKMTVAVECAQFRQLQPSDIDADALAHKLDTAKIIKNVKNPAIVEGQPLPNQGSCKHYKKSYRWLRFPCCGKAYPCDICHDDHEKGDHEMKYANRMICGFCAREQTFAGDRPCVACHNSLTRRPTHHWEGGKGCRDVIRMSKTDDKKYSNLNKTVSRHAQAKKQTGQKTTKLRHS